MPSILSKLSVSSFLPWPSWCWQGSLFPLPSHSLALALPLALLGILSALPRLAASYRAYLALGPGGVPHNPVGYLAQAALKLVARSDLRAVPPPYHCCYQRRSGGEGEEGARETGAAVAEPDPEVVRAYAPLGRESFLDADEEAEADAEEGKREGERERGGGGMNKHRLPVRAPPRPTVPGFVAPQRQTDMQASRAMVERMEAFMREVVDRQEGGRDGGWLAIRPSRLEGVGTPAVWLDDGKVEVPGFMGMCGGEIAHVHWEGSSHMTLSLVDAEEAVEKGWAERHALSGVKLPWSYVMVYAPRDDDEFEVWKRLIVAACRFVGGGRKIKM